MITIELNKYRNITHVPIEECAFLYDYGQKIRVVADSWPNVVEAHFSLVDVDNNVSYISPATVTSTTQRDFLIPNAVFQHSEFANGKMYNVYIFLFDSESTEKGHTFHKIILPVMCRPIVGDTPIEPDPPYTPEDIRRLNARVAALEALVENGAYFEQ